MRDQNGSVRAAVVSGADDRAQTEEEWVHGNGTRIAGSGRRDFLRTLGVGATAVAATATAGRRSARRYRKATMRSARLATRRTEHVKTFYRVNRYPS